MVRDLRESQGGGTSRGLLRGTGGWTGGRAGPCEGIRYFTFMEMQLTFNIMLVSGVQPNNSLFLSIAK